MELKRIHLATDEDIIFLTVGGDTYRNRYWKNSPGGHNKNKFRKLPKRCAHCGTTKGPFDIHGPHGPGTSRKNLNSRKGLIVLCRSCHKKLHDRLRGGHSKGDLDDKVAIYAQGSIVTEPNESHLKAIASIGEKEGVKIGKDDVLYTLFKLCHKGANGNRDEFLDTELTEHHASARYQAIDWEHREPNIGTIYDSKYVVDDPEDKLPYVLCAGVVWKRRYPELARKMVERYNEGELFYSMEVWFKQAECSVCHGTYTHADDYCTCLKLRHSSIGKANRILHSIAFAGAGVTEKPADKNASNVKLS